MKDKTVLITGGGSGIGRATSKLFAEEGSKVVVTDIDPEGGKETVEEILDSGGEATFIQSDVSNALDVKEMVEESVEKYGRIDVLHNNAGVEIQKTLTETTLEEWDRILNINLKGTFLCSKYVIPHMIEEGEGGAIINMGSIGGYVGYPSTAAYVASKGGVISLTYSAALDYADHNIRVNCICPAVVWTPMIKKFIADSEDPGEMRQTIETQQPIARVAEPDEIANVVLFLASEKSSYMTGSIIPVDGGYTAK